MPSKKSYLSATALFIVFFLGLPAMAQNNIGGMYLGNLSEPEAEFAPDRVVVKFAESVTDAEVNEIVKKMKSKIKRKARRNRFGLLSVPRGRVWKTVEALRKNPRVRYAHPDWKAYATVFPNDQYFSLQWHLGPPDSGGIHMQAAWELNPGGSPDVTVAVMDSGIAYEDYGSFCQAPDFAETQFVPGYDFVNNDTHPNDDNSHGTHVAGTIAQSTNNHIGTAGIAYNVMLMPLKVLGADGSGYISDIAEGIEWAADNGADVINMSFGTSAPWYYLTALQNAVTYAYNNGVLLVASSGNNNGGTPLYPANYPQVIAVGATLLDKSLASYSAIGNEVCAPGGTDQREDLNGDGYFDMVLQNTFEPETTNFCNFSYWFFSGTSMAAPHVSGLSALLFSANPDLTHEDVRQILRDTADQYGDAACGYGFINAYTALQAADPGDTPPQVAFVQPSDGAVVSGDVVLQIDASDDQPELLVVEWSFDGGSSWRSADYDADSGFYEATWYTASYPDDEYTLQARATETDGDPQTTESSITVTVNNDNAAPVAAFTYTCDGSICDFDASGSYDTDGTIVNYTWDFGDGNSGSGISASHTFSEVGRFTVTLTVTDDIGAEGYASNDVEIAELTNTLHVADLDEDSYRLFWRFWGTTVTITVKDAGDSPVAGAIVSGVFSDGPTLFQCTTDNSGECWVEGYQYWLRCLTFTVVDVYHPALDYHPEENTDPEGDSDGSNIVTCRP
jgi:serine protease